MEKNEAEKAAALDYLIPKLTTGTQVYTACDHVSASGMTRNIKVFIVLNGEIVNISYYVSKVLDLKMVKGEQSLIVKGCGMDMGFHVVYSLSRAIFPNGTPSKSDGGYALSHRWV